MCPTSFVKTCKEERKKRKITQKFIWVLNGSLLLENHAPKWTKFTSKCHKQRENQKTFLCLGNIRVIIRSSVHIIMRIFWVSQEKEEYIPKMGLKILQNGLGGKGNMSYYFLCDFQSNSNSYLCRIS